MENMRTADFLQMLTDLKVDAPVRESRYSVQFKDESDERWLILRKLDNGMLDLSNFPFI